MVEGISRAKIDQYHEGNAKKLVPILIHGDHSMAGQGIVYEVLQMSKLPGYETGGTVHLVINNQVGFTAGFIEGRSRPIVLMWEKQLSHQFFMLTQMILRP
ncbi:MAG: hypothetical protein Ct9H300mP28_08260 [Pseudomonadota bacterium]|nr:MAG: hypothetical protein Ct9H300mP28_08260 [Pseudomonadota bacterium]